MGRKEKKKKHEEYATNTSTSFVVASTDDDDEANEDLSLKIVQKALLLRAPNPQNEDVLDGPRGIAASEVDSVVIKSERKKKKKKRKLESGDQIAVVVEEEEAVETIKATEKKEPAEADTVQMSDNTVLRKLLRGPRYFDPPTEIGWGTCYNCGEEGHAAVNCTAAKRKKPCFVCGSLGHSIKQCSTARDCFICKKGGHRAKDCPEKFQGGSKTWRMCLKCGNSGHEMFSCKNDYSKDDLKEMQCYVCKRFGHLCCVNTTDATLREISCYKCGQLGHTGLACSRLRTEITVAAIPSSCNKCGEEGHFTRECSCFVKACSRFQIETTDATTPSSCYKGDEQGHFAQECSSSVKVGKRRPELSSTKTPRFQKENDSMGYVSAPQERSITTPQKSKHIGGWMIEHPEEFSHLQSKGNSWSWRSPVTPSNKSTKIYSFSNGNHTPSSKYSKMMNIIDGTPNSRGSAKAFHHRFASRFCNSGSDEFGRSYKWR